MLKVVTARIVVTVEFGMRFQSIVGRPTLAVLVRNAIVTNDIASRAHCTMSLWRMGGGGALAAKARAWLAEMEAAAGKGLAEERV